MVSINFWYNPRFRNFFSKLHNILTTGQNFQRRGVDNGIVCIHCGHPVKLIDKLSLSATLQKRCGIIHSLGRKWLQTTAYDFKDVIHSIAIQYDEAQVAAFCNPCLVNLVCMSFPRKIAALVRI